MPQFAYILSASFSGSTLLVHLLGKHEDVATVGELKATAMGEIDNYVCSCGEKINSCRFWASLGQMLAKKGVNFRLDEFGTHFCDHRRRTINKILTTQLRGALFEKCRRLVLHSVPAVRRQYVNILKRNRVFVDTVLQHTGSDIFLDSSKDPLRLSYLWKSGWSVKVIYLVRDGRGTANSFMKHYDMSMKEAALEWRSCYESCEGLIANLPRNSWCKVHYEEMCMDPDTTISKIRTFLGLGTVIALKRRGQVQHILGNNGMRLAKTEDIRLDEQWKDVLSQGDLETFDALAGVMNRAQGYE